MKRTFSKNWRFLLVVLGFSSLFLLVVLRAFQLQVLPEKRVVKMADGQFQRELKVEGRRANILDVRGKNLAVSLNAYSIFVDPSLVRNKKPLARRLARILELPYTEILSKLSQKKRRFLWIARRQDIRAKQRVEALGDRSLGVIKEYQRMYPLDRVGAPLLGFTSTDGSGLEGLERKYDRFLRTKSEIVNIKRDAKGRPLFEKAPNLSQKVNWKSLQLNIDANLQYYSEKILKEAVEKSDAVGGVVIIMDPNTGALRSMVSLPSYDPNRYQEFSPESRRNRAITDPIEPGSVLKVFTAAQAMELGVATPETKIRVIGKNIKIGNKTIRDSHEENEKEFWTVREMLRLSSNVAAIRLAEKLGFQKMGDVFDTLGFSSKTGVDLPGESSGIFRRPKNSQKLEWSTITFGQGIALTPLQVLCAFATLANGGKMVLPRIAKTALTDGKIAWENVDGIDPRKQIFSEGTLKSMREMMVAITEDGTAPLARVPGFKVAGKTGTAQKVDFKDGGYKKGAYWASFVGFLPAENPRYVAYVMIDEPRKGSYYGGMIAAPVFSKIMKYAMRLPDFNEKIKDVTMVKRNFDQGNM